MNFKISEFNITGDPIPQDVADKVLLYHISPMQLVRDVMNIPIWSSLKSGYRPVWREMQNKLKPVTSLGWLKWLFFGIGLFVGGMVF